MSIELYSLIRRRSVGSPTKKSILLYMADAASDDGSGIWVSKGNMAADLEMKSKRTVQTNISELVAAGIVFEVGQRKCRNGFTVEYRIDLGAVLSLPSTRAGNAPLPVQEMHPNHPFNHYRTLCPAGADHTQDLDFDFQDFISKFSSVYPRMGDAEKTEDALGTALGEGADPQEVLAGAKAYAIEQEGNKPRYILYSENWLKQKRWRLLVTKPKEPVDPKKILNARAKTILEGKPFICRHITAAAAGECINAQLVTVEQCRTAGINL